VSAWWKVVKRRPRVVVVQNHRQFVAVWLLAAARRFGFTKRLVWDLRELPIGFLQGSLRKKLFKKILSICDAVIATSAPRVEFMRSCYGEEAIAGITVIPNYVTEDFVNASHCRLEDRVATWLGEREYFYIQNPASKERLLLPAVEAIVQRTCKAMVVTGNIGKEVINDVSRSIGDEIARERIFYVGAVDENWLPSYIDNAIASIVLYKRDHPNREYAEPNRLYQSIGRGIPVIVGQNAGLRPAVDVTGAGVVLQDDGSSEESVARGVRELLDFYGYYKKNAEDARRAFMWETHDGALLNAIAGDACP
jgi:glycosyltransferase involved in cell wall biosynthesis